MSISGVQLSCKGIADGLCDTVGKASGDGYQRCSKMSMMSPLPTADDVSPLTLRNDVASLRAAMMRCLPYVPAGTHHSKTRDLSAKSRVFVVEERVKVYQGIERKPKSTPGILVNYCLQIGHVSNLK